MCMGCLFMVAGLLLFKYQLAYVFFCFDANSIGGINAKLSWSYAGFVHGMIHGFLLHGAYHEVDEYVKPQWSAEA